MGWSGGGQTSVGSGQWAVVSAQLFSADRVTPGVSPRQRDAWLL